MLFVALILIMTGYRAAPSSYVPVTAATVGLGCYDSQVVVGTGNVPVGSDRATTVVNIWAYLTLDPAGQSIPLAWVYKNGAGEFWIQVDLNHSADIRRVFRKKVADELLRGLNGEPRSILQKVSDLRAYDADFAKVPAIRQGCFSRDLSTKYY